MTFFDIVIGYGVIVSVRTTDIDLLRDKNMLFIYASDYGESIADGKRFHATPRHIEPAEEFRVPIIVCASDRFIARSAQRQEVFARLQQLENGSVMI